LKQHFDWGPPGYALGGDRPVSSLVVSLGKALNGIASTFEWLDW